MAPPRTVPEMASPSVGAFVGVVDRVDHQRPKQPVHVSYEDGDDEWLSLADPDLEVLARADGGQAVRGCLQKRQIFLETHLT